MNPVFQSLHKNRVERFCVPVMMAALALAPNAWSSNLAQLLSSRDPSTAQSTSANGSSVASYFSADGRFLVFSSSACDLVTNDNGYLGLDVFLRDRFSNTCVLVSANVNGTGGGNGHSAYGSASTNGGSVVFESFASNLVPGDTNDASDIFVRNLIAGTTTLVSVSTNGSTGNGPSSDAVMTTDGRFVAFASAASNLIAGDTNGIPDVFVRDLVGGTTTLASLGATNIASVSTVVSAPAMTPDGRFVVFSSNARGLAPGIPANPQGEVYLRDRVGGSTIWASTNALAIVTNLLKASSATTISSQASVSDDGQFVAFKTVGTNSPGQHMILIFQFDTATRTTSLIETNGVLPATGQNDDWYGPEMSPDGRFVSYAARKINTNTVVIQQWDAVAGTNILVSADLNGEVPTNSFSHSATASPDGRFVAFVSDATNLVTNVVSSGFHVYLRDLQNGVTHLVDANTNGVGAADNWGTVLFLSTNGPLVAMDSRDGSLVGSDGNNSSDVFVRDVNAGTTELISQRDTQEMVQAASTLNSSVSASADGRWVAFSSFASDLVTNDFNGERDVFVHDALTGSNILVSVATDGLAGAGGDSVTPVISGDGRYVAFVSLATNLVANDTNRAADIFRRDLQTGSTILVNVNAAGTSLATNNASAPVISADGRYVAFLNFTNASATIPATFLRDVVGGTTTKLAPASPIAPSISADGQRVVYFNSVSSLLVWDAALGMNVHTNTTVMASAAISPDGTRVLYQTPSRQLFARDLAAPTNRFIVTASAAIRSPTPWSADGRYFAFVTSTSLIPGDNNNATNDVYLYDFQTGTVTLLSANSGGTASANGPSDWPVVSANGRFVVFRTFATDVAAGVLNPPSLVAFDRFTGTATLLSTGTPDSGWSSWIVQPTVSSSGSVAFVSWDSGLVAGDLNRASDVFGQAISAESSADTDSDGIPDWWTQGQFGHATGQPGDQSLAGDDPDGDGLNNLQEYLSGTTPTDSNSVLRIQISAVGAPGGNVVLTWPAVAGRSYQVQSKDNLDDPAWLNITGGVTVLGSQARFAAPMAPAGRYYQVVLVN